MAKDKKVLVVGGGGRCHAIVDALSRSPQVAKIWCAPGNAGIAAQAECVPLKDTDVQGLLAFAQQQGIDLTVVGPEAALSVGVVDAFRAAGLRIFGHTQAATRIESSKEFAKVLMDKYGIPTAGYRSFDDFQEALDYVNARPLPAVLKYDGLAAGKGVVIAARPEEAEAALRSMLLDEAFGKGRVVVEDYLTGPEFSFMAFVDGERVYPMPLSQDHKRAFDGDKGPNTGGMGAYTGLPFITEEDRTFALEHILKATAKAMCAEGCPLSGVLYGGLMKTPGGIKVIEFNARFGDPETEVVLPLLESDIYDIFEAVATGREAAAPVWRKAVTLGVVLASKGYPGHYDKGFEIQGVEEVDARVYHMGTKRDGDRLLTAGGRVMMVVAEGRDIRSAQQKAYAEVAKVSCEALFHRRDIAHVALDGRILDGKALSDHIKDELKDRVGRLEVKYGRKPSLAVIIVGNNPASQVYVRNKVKSAIYVGMNSRLITMAEDVTEQALLEMIGSLNRDPEVDGILVQLPLPKQIDEERVIDAIDKSKDVDGFHVLNVGDLWLGRPCSVPCTPKGILRLIDESGIDLCGKTAVVVGRSNIVGKPVAKLLLDRNATVIVAHSRTKDLRSVTLQADVLVVAVGRENVVTGDMVKPGAVVIDVGMNRNAEGRLCGDVDFVGARQRASWITPVPGGVGPMTIAMLMENTVECFLARVENK
ncbi:MAG: phosphoribosylamine--glycine ligase [Bacteroidales bacterium]|nr:phosphoribosylamine--glycine ligase [Bacteroidales bacterium]